MTYVSQCVTTDGAVGLYALADASVADSATALDQASIQNGAYASSGWTGGQTGIPGAVALNAARVTAAGGWIVVPDIAGNRTADTFTYELWIKMTALPGSTSGLMGNNVGSATMFRILTSGQLLLTKQASGDIVSSTSNVAADSAWHHCVCTKNGGTVKLYIDGVDVTGSVSNQTLNSSSGGGYTLAKEAADNAPAATFAMFGIYPTALSSTIVANHYSLGSSAGTFIARNIGARTG